MVDTFTNYLTLNFDSFCLLAYALKKPVINYIPIYVLQCVVDITCDNHTETIQLNL